MNQPPLLSRGEIERLLSQQTRSELHPWVTNDERLIEAYLKGACAAVTRATRSEARVEWGHYGSGYASFVDAWLYKTTPDFNVKHPIRHGEGHIGLVVLLSRLSPYFVFMQGEKRWHASGGSSYLPEFDMLDKLEAKSVLLLARQPFSRAMGWFALFESNYPTRCLQVSGSPQFSLIEGSLSLMHCSTGRTSP